LNTPGFGETVNEYERVKGLSNDTTLMQIQSGRTVPLSPIFSQAIKNIFKGEEICENYGPIFFHSAREDRQSRLLKQYWFQCQCQVQYPHSHSAREDRQSRLLKQYWFQCRCQVQYPHCHSARRTGSPAYSRNSFQKICSYLWFLAALRAPIFLGSFTLKTGRYAYPAHRAFAAHLQ
jgi:hypothetical protein